MTRLNAVKTFLGQDTSRPVTTVEFMEFWKACSEAERQEFGEQSAKQLGEELTS